MRNKDYKTKMREKKRKEAAAGDGGAKRDESKQASRIKAYDYRSWDKFDVVADAVLIKPFSLMSLVSKSNQRFLIVRSQDKALMEMDKEESPAESNESDSEEATVDQEKALAEKEKVNTT